MKVWLSLGLALACLAGCTPAPTAKPSPAVTGTPRLASTALPSFTPTISATPPAPSATATPTAAVPTAFPIPSATLAPPLPTADPPQFTYRPYELVLDLAWSEDGRWLAVAAGENIHLYNGQSLAERSVLAAGVWVNGLAFSPQGDRLALAGRDGAVQLWEVEAGQQVCAFPAHLRGANSVSFDPAGGVLASTGNDAIVKFWDITVLEGCDPPLLAQTIGGAFGVPAIRYSPSGSFVASVDRQAVRLRNASDQRLVRTFQSNAAVFNIAFSRDGSLLATGEISETVRLWEVGSGELRGVLVDDAPQAFVWGVDISPDQRWLAAGTSRGRVTLWDLETGQIKKRYTGPTLAVTRVAFSPDGRWLAAGGLDAMLWKWEIEP